MPPQSPRLAIGRRESKPMRDMTGSQESWEKCLRWSCWKPRRQRSHYLRLYWSTNRHPTQHAQRSRSPTMRMYPRDFPPSRRKIPKRRAERQVYEALAGSDRQGFVYYEWRKGYGHIELDFAVWVEELGRFALQVKGGHYLLIDGEWHLKTRNGVQPIAASPLDEAWLAALDLHDDIEELAETAYNPFVIPVVSFTDMDPDEAIVKLARRKGVHLVWRTDDFMADLIATVRRRGVPASLTMERISREVYAVTDGLIRLDVPVGDETSQKAARPIALYLSVGGRNVLQVRTREMHLRFRTVIGIGTPQKGSDGRRR